MDPVAWGKIGRVKQAIEKLDSSTSTLTNKIIHLTYVLIFLNVILVALTAFLVPEKRWVIIVVVGIALYFILKMVLLLLRPFFLKKFFEEIDMLYNKTKAITSKDIEMAIENLQKWQAKDISITICSSENGLQSYIKAAQADHQHEQEVYEKFLRCREKFIQNPEKLSDVIVIYKRYLTVKLKQLSDSKLFSGALASGAITSEELETSAKELRLILEENENKLDALL